ncbi:hypothetical protein SAMN05216360_110150 [Methylobacterium phyllostachyos]|uniref:Uncharacterized protein n=1 Tax=Methylobacterium phyllostachyos TaxID=582672 RepID=A0A1H0DFI0_9HYPH|nr:hypothetical protein [Methylobacterium phyllostachyos]SDN69027.1 hypothetical protein SAMN05216360_110150 [Methylobacterium phyllostachyos]
MRIAARLSARLRFGLRRGGTACASPVPVPVPVRRWPEEAALWLDENGVRRPRAARHALVALAILGRRGRYAARRAGSGKVVTGPASVLALHDAQAEIAFVFRVTSCGYGEEPF